MKTNIKRFLIGLSVLAFLPACETEKVPTFDTTLDGMFFGRINPNYRDKVIDFVVDTTRLSFGLLPDPYVESAVFPIRVYLLGSVADHDREFHAEALRGPTNPQTRYEIIQPSILKAGQTEADIEVRVWRTDNLIAARDTILIGLKDSKDLVVTVKSDLASRYVTIYGGFDRPTWWNDNYVNQYMGRFHEIKMGILLEVLGSIADPYAPSANQWIFYQTIINLYCQENDIRYPDTGEIVSFLGESYL